jgi:chromatin remodeling complex protein RSC6
MTLFESGKKSAVVETEFDEFAGMDEETRAKAIKRREVSDKKKEDQWAEAKKKSEENEAKKKEQRVEKAKATAKDKSKGKKRKLETSNPNQATSDGVVKDTLSGFSLTQECLLHGLPAQDQGLESSRLVDECILNVSVTSLIGSENGPMPDVFNDVISFIDKVIS